MSNIATNQVAESATLSPMDITIVWCLLRRAMFRAGFDPSGLTLRDATLDHTWGQRTGIVVTGADQAMCERAASWILTYATKHITRETSEVSLRGKYSVKKQENLTDNYLVVRGHQDGPGWAHGQAVSLYYFSCAD